MKIRRLYDRILARRLDEQAGTPGGLFVPDSAVLLANGTITEHSAINADRAPA
jgi:co-chaperonin GroES (HSP10)